MANKLKEALARGNRFEAELKTPDPATRAHLVAAWKELILDQLVDLFRVTDDLGILRIVDQFIALGQDIQAGELHRRDSSGGV